jgi:hypothetical protein
MRFTGREVKAQAPAVASAEIPLPEGEPIKLDVSPAGRKPQRLVVATRGEVEHRDHFCTNSCISRDRFIRRLATKLAVDSDVLAPLIDNQITKLAGEADRKGPADKAEVQSQATLVATLAADWELWHTPDMVAYATVPVGDHKEHWPVRSQAFKQLLAKLLFDAEGQAASTETLAAATNLVEAKALFEGKEHPAYVRLADHDGDIYLDLCNQTWQAVRVTPQGWEVIEDPPVRFRRSRGMLDLPTPEPGGTVDQLRDFVNLDDNAWMLVVSWLVAALRPRGPYPILALFAEQGSGKSTVGRLLRELVDPNVAPLRAEPSDGRDLMIAANNSWCLAFDNLSHVPPWLSDALCRLATGAGLAVRQLYTDQDEVIFDSQRPLLLTSIEEVAARADLLDRCLIVGLPAIPEERRRPEAELFKAFHKVRPQILGALLDAVAVALQRLPSIKLPGLPRMADFAVWAAAAEPAFGWPDGAFMDAYQDNRESASEVAIEAAVIADPLIRLLATTSGRWEGTARELLDALEQHADDGTRRRRDWPGTPRRLAGELRRLAPNLRRAGVEATFDREPRRERRRLIRLERLASPGPEDVTKMQALDDVDDSHSPTVHQAHSEFCGVLDDVDGVDGSAGLRDGTNGAHGEWVIDHDS